MDENKENEIIQEAAGGLYPLLMLREVAKKVIAIILVAVIAMSCAYMLVTSAYNPQYQTKTTFLISVRDGSSSVYSNLRAAENLTKSFSKIVSSETLKRQIENDLGVEKIDGTIEATIVEATNILELRVTASNPRDAYLITDSLLRNYGPMAEKTMGNVALDVFQPPKVPTNPINPLSIRKPVMVAGVIAAIAMAALICALAYLRDTVKTMDDAKNKIDAKLLGVIPHENKYKTLKSQLERKKSSILVSNPTTGFDFVETFRKIRTKIDYTMRKNNLKTVMVTSVMEDEGKSTVAVNLALAMKKKYENVLLIDADLKKSALYKILEYKQLGFTTINELLEGKATLENALVKDDETGIYLLLGRNGIENSTELVSSEEMKQLIEQVVQSMDVVIIDTPPMAASPDAECIAEIADAAVIVVRQDMSPVRIINDMVDDINASKAKLLGVILNDYRSVDINDNFSYGQDRHSYGKYGYGKYGYGKYGYGKYGYGKYGYGKYGYGKYGYGKYGYGNLKSRTDHDEEGM